MFAQQDRLKSEEEPDWPGAVDWTKAACRVEGGSMVDLFFSEQLDDITLAKEICTTCPVIDPCLAGARERREPWGVWGGQLFMNGVILPYKRKRGRPPKHLSMAALGA